MAEILAKRGPAYAFYENVPKISIITALIYLITVYINAVTNGMLSGYHDIATTAMLFGAILAVPAIIMDFAFTHTVERGEIIMVGFVNFFALLTEYYFSNTAEFITAAKYAIYIYLGLFLVALIVYAVLAVT